MKTPIPEFEAELSTLTAPVSQDKIYSLTKQALSENHKFFKFVVYHIEKAISKARSDLKVPYLYVIDSIINNSRHKYGIDNDVYAPRFEKAIKQTFLHLFKCSSADQKRVLKVLELWKSKEIYSTELIDSLIPTTLRDNNPKKENAPKTSSVSNEPTKYVDPLESILNSFGYDDDASENVKEPEQHASQPSRNIQPTAQKVEPAPFTQSSTIEFSGSNQYPSTSNAADTPEHANILPQKDDGMYESKDDVDNALLPFLNSGFQGEIMAKLSAIVNESNQQEQEQPAIPTENYTNETATIRSSRDTHSPSRDISGHQPTLSAEYSLQASHTADFPLPTHNDHTQMYTKLMFQQQRRIGQLEPAHIHPSPYHPAAHHSATHHLAPHLPMPIDGHRLPPRAQSPKPINISAVDGPPPPHPAPPRPPHALWAENEASYARKPFRDIPHIQASNIPPAAHECPNGCIRCMFDTSVQPVSSMINLVKLQIQLSQQMHGMNYMKLIPT